MESISAPRQVRLPLGNRRISSFALGLALLLLVAVNLGSLHHHHDLQAHADCAVCLVVHHSPVEAAGLPSLQLPLPFPYLLLFFPLSAAIISRRPSTINGRAPPCAGAVANEP
jgi:hypothetical protein